MCIREKLYSRTLMQIYYCGSHNTSVAMDLYEINRKQEGNSNIDCIPRAGKPKSARAQAEGGSLARKCSCPGTLAK